MELIMENTDIFDLDLYDKINQAIKNSSFDIQDGSWYKLEVIFNLNLLYNEKMKEYCTKYVPVKPNDKSKREDRDFIYDYLSYVLDKVRDIFTNHNIQLDDLTIAGDNIETENSIILELQESARISELLETDKRCRRKKPEQFVFTIIMPSRPGVYKRIHNFIERKINQAFYDCLDEFGADAMCEILEINKTHNLKKLFKEFTNFYLRMNGLGTGGEPYELKPRNIILL